MCESEGQRVRIRIYKCAGKDWVCVSECVCVYEFECVRVSVSVCVRLHEGFVCIYYLKVGEECACACVVGEKGAREKE